MRKKFLTIILLLTFFLPFLISTSKPVSAESIKTLNLSKYKISGDNPIETYFLGWSKDGKIAYIIFEEANGIGGNYLKMYIKDLVEDKILYEEKVHEIFENYNDPSEKLIKSIITKKYENALKQHKIVISYLSIKNFPVIYGSENNQKINAVITINESKTDGIPYINYTVKAVRNDGLSKIVTSEQKEWLYDVEIIGYIKSPFEERICIITGSLNQGFECYDFYLDFYGCNLLVGFN